MIKTVIIEDSKATQMLLAHQIKKHYLFKLINIFDNSEEAIDFINKNEVDIVFIDFYLKNKTTLNLMKEIGSNKIIKVLLSSERSHSLFRKTKDAGLVDDYFAKPLTQEDLDQIKDSLWIR